MTKLDYSDPKDRDQVQARLQALSLAHNTDHVPEDVVARAKAYLDFAEGA